MSTPPSEQTLDKLLPKTEVTETEGFRHYVRWGTLRKGQRCRILRQRGLMAHVCFEDGATAVVSRQSLRRVSRADNPERTTLPHAPQSTDH